MRKRNLLVSLLVVLAFGLVAAGCGSDDDSTETTTPATTTETTATEDTTATETTATDDTTTEETSTSSDTSGGTSPDDVYDACIDTISGTPAEAAGKSACEQARTAFEQCEQQAASADGSAGESAAAICQDAADQAIQTLKSASGG